MSKLGLVLREISKLESQIVETKDETKITAILNKINSLKEDMNG